MFASDNLSSSAYATEEILHVLIPVVGLAAFSLVVPITVAMVVVLGFLILSYRETIKEYPSAGGAYLVTRDNFGIVPGPGGGGVAAHRLHPHRRGVGLGRARRRWSRRSTASRRTGCRSRCFFIALIAYGNLRGVKESGRIFAVPTYFFIVNMALLLGHRGCGSTSAATCPTSPGCVQEGQLELDGVGVSGTACFYGGGLFGVLHAFASGGAAVTGVEAISNGVPAFREPAWRNARQTLVIMGTGLGVMFLGLSALAAEIARRPRSRRARRP